MAENQRKFDIVIGSSYQGAGVKSAAADVAALRKQLEMPTMGPLSREQSQVEALAAVRIRAMEAAADRSRLSSIVNEKLFGVPEARKRYVRDAGEQGVRDAMAEKLRQIRTDTIEADRKRYADTAKERILGVDREAAAIEAFGQKMKAAAGNGGTLLEILKKIGTSNGTDAIVEKLAKAAPKIGIGLAIAKGASLGLDAINFGLNELRHGRQGDLDALVEDDKKKEAFLTGIPVLGRLGAGIQKLNPFSSRRGNEAAIEELNLSLKKQLLDQARQDRLIAAGSAQRDSSEQAATQLRGAEAIRRTPLAANYITAKAELDAMYRRFDRSNTNPDKNADAGEERDARLRAVETARVDYLEAMDRRSRDERDAARERLTQNADAEKAVTAAGLEALGRGEEARRAVLVASQEAELRAVKDSGEKILVARRQRYQLEAMDLEQSRARQDRIRALDAGTAGIFGRLAGRSTEAEIKRLADEQAAALEKLPGGSNEWWATLKNFEAQKHGVRTDADRATRDLKSDFARQMFGTDSGLRERMMRLFGDNESADRFSNQSSLTAKYAEIRDKFDKAIRANAENKDLYEQQRSDEQAAARNEFVLRDAETRQRRHAANTPPGPGDISGDTHLLRGVSSLTPRETDSARERATRDLAAAAKDLKPVLAQLAAALENGTGLKVLSPNP